MSNASRFKYNRGAFRPLPVRLEHIDLHLDFTPSGPVEVCAMLRMSVRKPVDRLVLDARDLEIKSVALAGSGEQALKHQYRREKNRLIVKLPRVFEEGERFSISVRSACTPADNILEGIYKDTTPQGCPQQYMSQCQQWGFQRIAPVFDDCTAKCTFTTTIEADARYTHLISNGNVSRKTNPDGKPALKPGDPSRKVITYENDIPMAPYLFICAVGTWDVVEDEVVYASGGRVKLEYLVPPGRKVGVAVPMKILKDSIAWHGRTQDYEYTRDVYRTICMEKSNFGGMENVGNTTIITDAALVDEFTGDRRLQYAHGVIVHEFEHNQCGSDVTMETPFDMWLNEAFTVDVERQFLMSRFDPDCVRLDEVDDMRAPIGGPLSVEDAGHLGNIVRKGFNDPDELVDGVTYVKAAEVIRMLRLVVGAEAFRKAKNLYFERHKGGNANTDQFLACFEEVSGRDLTQFKEQWLYTIGYPRIRATHKYSRRSGTLTVRLAQSRVGKGRMFHVPLEMSAVDGRGLDIPATKTLVELTGSRHTLKFENVPEPAFISFNRDCSFYGTFEDESARPEDLVKQTRLDPNRFNRVEAMRRLTDIERVKLIADPSAEIGVGWSDVFGGILRDDSLPAGLKAYLLRIDEQSMNREYLPLYRERYEARIKLLEAAADRWMEELVRVYHATDTYRRAVEPKDGFEERRLKAVLLRTIIAAGTPEAHRLAEEHFREAWNITDRVSALACVSISGHPRRDELMNEAREMWKTHLSAYSSYLGIVGSGVHDDVFRNMATEEGRPEFVIQHPTHSRSLFFSMAGNNKMLWTDRGLDWATKTVVLLAGINDNAAMRLVTTFQQVNNLKPDLRQKVTAALEAMRKGVDAKSAPSVAGRLDTYLQGVE